MLDKQTIKEYFFIALGTFLVSFSIYYLMAPQNLATGGVSGLAIIIADYAKLPISVISLVINVLLLIVGFIFIGREFGAKTIFSVILLSVFMYLMETFYPSNGPATDEVLLNLTASIIISAFGMSIVFNQNASTGGTDIVAKLFNKYFNLDIGMGLMAADVFVVSFAFVTFGISTGLIGALGWFMNGLIVNYFIDGFNLKKEVSVICNEPDKVIDFIFSRLERGATIYKAEGGYTRQPKDIVVTIVSKNEYFLIKKELKKIDKTAFMIVRNVHEVLGEGFDEFN